MARITWPLHRGRPTIEIEVVILDTDRAQSKRLLADTGAGSQVAPFELLLSEEDCLLSAQRTGPFVGLSGAYVGAHRTYVIEIRIPQLQFSSPAIAVGVDEPPTDFDGITGFRFLNRFAYGNFGAAEFFGLEC